MWSGTSAVKVFTDERSPALQHFGRLRFLGDCRKTMETIEQVRGCATFADEKKAKDILVIDLTGLTDIADFFLIASGTSERHVRTIAESIEKGMKEAGIRPFSLEGYDEGRWVIMDYQSIIVHVFLEPLRELYDLESLWIEAKRYKINRENKTLEVDNGKVKA